MVKNIKEVFFVGLGLFSLTIISGLILSDTIVSADDSVVDEINITVPVFCTLSGTGMNTHNANIANGTYTADIGTTTLKAFCNDNNGFSIYAAGYTGNEIGATNSNKLVGTAASSNATIDTGTATSAGNPDISNWAMKLAITQDSGDTTDTNAFTIDSAPNVDLPSTADSSATPASFGDYHVVPNEYVKVAHKNSVTDMTTTTGGVKLTTTYAAYISKTQPADTYTGQVIYTLVHPADAAAPYVPHAVDCEPGHICYNANANDIVGTMSQQDLKVRDWSSCSYTDNQTYCRDDNNNEVDPSTLPYADGTSIENATLFASNFKREGYGFAGWNDSYDITGTNYGPNQTIPITQDIMDNGLSLYAHWVESTGNLQGWTGCNTLEQNQVIGLTDTRDGNVYAVAKLADGNCWMIENLRLSSSKVALSSANTNNPTPDFTALSPSSDDWCSDEDDVCINQNILNSNNTTLFTNNTNGLQTGDIYSYGNYYNWYTATAGTGTYSSTPIPIDASGSICPNNWILPSGFQVNGDNGQFSALDLAMGGTGEYQDSVEASNRWRSYPANFLYSGITLDDRGSFGTYWSRSGDQSERNSAGSLKFYTNEVDLLEYRSKNEGLMVRCLNLGS